VDIVREWVKRGPVPAGPNGSFVPGVNYVIRPDGRRIRVTDKNAETVAETVEISWTVERQLVDGDIVLFNRQPSLHRMSMMAHEVRVMPHKTCCNPKKRARRPRSSCACRSTSSARDSAGP
jgi:DNA-directed RNA polymerase subunit A'